MKFLALLKACLVSSNCLAQVLEVDTILRNDDEEKFINFVVLGDGYTADQEDEFSADARDFTEYLIAQEPYQNYRNFFNVFGIKVASNESGADHPGDATDVNEPAFDIIGVDNYFGSTFDGFGSHRLLIVKNTFAVFEVLANNFP